MLAAPTVTLIAAIGDAANRLIYTIVATEGDESQIKSVLGIGDYEVYISDEDDQAEYLKKHGASEETTADFTIDTSDINGGYGIPNIRLTPSEIFSNSISMLNANFFKEDSSSRSIVGTLKNTIASWYNSLRLISLAGLLAVLAYIGIRVMLSSTAADKAKYKERAKDWFIAMCLVFFLHYIMVFIMTSVDEVTSVLSEANSSTSEEDNTETIQNGVTEQIVVEVTDDGKTDELGGEKVKFYTNLTGYMRLLAEYNVVTIKFSAVFMYLMLTAYTVYFVIIYFKRLLTIIFLTLIAPLVALTYPLDKLKDGKAQAFNFWLREYIMNALLPIIHLVLYTVFVTSAADLIRRVPLYAVVALAFIVPAEKIVKEMFGFKSSTAPSSGFAQGMMANQLLQGAKKVKEKRPGGDAGHDKIKTYGDKGKIDSSYSDLALPGVGASGGSSPAGGSGSHGSAGGSNPAGGSGSHGSAGGSGRHRSTRRSRTTGGRTSKVSAIKNNAKKMVQRKYRAAGGMKGIGKGIIKNAPKKLGKAYVRAAGIATGAAIGLAGAAMTGNPENIVKGLAGGIAAGNVAGQRWNNRISEAASSASRIGNELLHGEDGASQLANIKEFKNNRNNIEYWESKHKIEANESQGDYIARRNRELENMAAYSQDVGGDIKKAEKMYEIEKDVLRERGMEDLTKWKNKSEKAQYETERANAQKYAAQIAKLSEQYSASDLRGSKKDEAIAEQKDKLMHAGLDDGQAGNRAETIVNQIKKYKGLA